MRLLTYNSEDKLKQVDKIGLNQRSNSKDYQRI